MVIYAHALTGFFRKPSDMPPTSGFFHGVLGVEVFFAISGLLITKLLLEEFDRHRRLNLRSFYIRRVFRILPIVFAFLAVVALLRWYVSPLDWISPLLFFRNYVDIGVHGGYFTAHFWSLAVEEHFYLFWPLVVFLLACRPRALIVVSLAASLCALLARLTGSLMGLSWWTTYVLTPSGWTA